MEVHSTIFVTVFLPKDQEGTQVDHLGGGAGAAGAGGGSAGGGATALPSSTAKWKLPAGLR